MFEDLTAFSMKFFNIVDRITHVKHIITKATGLDYAAKDSRLLGLDSLQQSLVACGTFMCGMHSLKILASDTCGADWEKQYARMINSAEGIAKSEDNCLDYLKRSIVTEACFSTENMFRNLMCFINHDYNKKKTFAEIRKDILGESKISDPDQKDAALKCMTSFRNSAHANGIHSQADFSAIIDGVSFNFEKSKPVTCFSWDHLLTALNRSIDTIIEIILSEKFLSIKEEIPDRALVLLGSTR